MDRLRSSSKRSDDELKRLVERAVRDVCGLAGTGLSFHVRAVEIHGRPPTVIRAWAALHFDARGAPYCCGEPGCHLALHGGRAREVSDHVRRAMRLRQELQIDFGDRVGVEYHEGVRFKNPGTGH